MKIVTPPLIIEETDSFQNDLFDRKAFGESLLNLVERSNGELVISLDGQWGEGKTTFVKMWQGLLNESNIPNLYIDAFANDYIDDAFISVASAITDFADAYTVDKDKASEFKDKAKKVGGKLLAWSTKLGIKAATLGLIKEAEIEELNGIKGDIAKSTSAIVNSFIEERLNSHSKDIELLSSFREILSELPTVLNNSADKPLVIIIDELDRCKPTYAVDVIEKIKHLFSVKNVVFMLVMHKKQLEEAVKCIYGQNIDAHTYLQKFIHIETSIPKRIGTSYTNDLGKYCRKLVELHEFKIWGDERLIAECTEVLASHFNLSLRQLEKVFTNIAILYSSSAENHLRLTPIISFISVIKVVNTSLFQNLLNRNASFSQVCRETKLSDTVETEDNKTSGKLQWIMKWVKFSILSEQEFRDIDDEDEIKKFGQALFQYNVDREGLIPIFIQKLSMFTVV